MLHTAKNGVKSYVTFFRPYTSYRGSVVLNVKALVGAFNQEKALVGAFSVIVKPMDRLQLYWTLEWAEMGDVGWECYTTLLLV